MTSDPVRAALAKKPTLLNAWITLGLPLAIEMVGAAGWDLATIDQQHGLGGPDRLVDCLVGARSAGLPALVRVAVNDPGLIGRALDAGASGIICPMVNTVADAQRLVDAAKYPPLGARSWGPYRARATGKGDYFAEANRTTLACAQIETAEALDNLDAILAVEGIDMVYVGPNDLTISLTGGQSRDIAGEVTSRAISRILDGCRRHEVIAGIYANDLDFAMPLIAAGWQVVTIGSDAQWLSEGAADAARRGRPAKG